jgi:hypothetical protein
VLADWGFGAVGTWLLAWGGLGLATPRACWALAATGAVVWALALPGRRPTESADSVPHAEIHG